MAKIQNETAYKAAMARVEELLPLVNEDTPLTDKNLIELDLLSGLVEEYEDEHYPIGTPSLVDIIKLRMYEMSLDGIHWPQLDEDISFESFEYDQPEPEGISRFFLSHPEINAAAVARRLGIGQSLFAQYINGTKHPSNARREEILAAVRNLGAELQASEF